MLAAVLIAYLLLLFGVSLYAGGKVHNEEDYLVAGRRLPLWLAWGTLLATWFGAATLLGAAEASRAEGVRGTVLDPFASGGALIIAGLFFARPLWEMQLLTMGDFYARKFGPKSEVLASIILVPGYFGWIAAQYVALAAIAQTFFGIDPIWGMPLVAGIVLLYTLIGGMWSVTLTDTLQMFVVLVTLVILGWSTFASFGDGSPTAGVARLITETHPAHLTLLPEAGAAAALVWTATWASGLLGNIPGQDLMQRVFASKDSRTAVQACILAGVVYLAFGLLPVGMGLVSRILHPGDAEGNILGILAERYLSTPLTIVFVISLVSIIVSTCTSAVLSPAAVLGHNLLHRITLFRQRPLLTDRLSVLAVAACSLAVAYSGKTILELLDLSLSTVLVALFVPLVMGLYGKPRGELPALLAMALGTAVWLGRELFEYVLVPMSDSATAGELPYPDHVTATVTADEFGLMLSLSAWLFALLPSAISGTLASFAGYFLGQKLASSVESTGPTTAR